MASVIRDTNGRKRIGFTAGDGRRKSLRLGKATLRQAEAVKVRVEQLVTASAGVTGVLDDETTKWLMGLDEVMYDKLAAVPPWARSCREYGAPSVRHGQAVLSGCRQKGAHSIKSF